MTPYTNTLESHAVINTTTGKVTERHFTAGRAHHAVNVCNEHERRNGRPEVYRYEHASLDAREA